MTYLHILYTAKPKHMERLIIICFKTMIDLAVNSTPQSTMVCGCISSALHLSLLL